jgi:chromosome partitioning protein
MEGYMGRVVAITNQKGGVGKTTTTVNLAASLALAKKKMLIVDLDPQGNASAACGLRQEEDARTIYPVLLGECTLQDVIQSTEMDRFYLAPANSELAGAEIELVQSYGREYRLKEALSAARSIYDYIFIDCPPSLGLLTVNALCAADSYLVPLQCEYFALEGLSQLIKTVGLIKKSLNPSLEQEGIVLTMYDSRNNLCKEVVKEVRAHFGDAVLQTHIPRNIRLSECSSFGKPIVLYDLESKGCLAYVNLATEFLFRHQKKPAKARRPRERDQRGEKEI